MTNMRSTFACLCLVLLSAIAVSAQEDVAAKSPHWNFGVFATGGSGLYQDSNVQMFGVGGRFGRVLMHERGPGILRGTFEWNGEVLPLYQFHREGETTTGAVINPIGMKWNFTRGKKVIPFFEAITGVILTTKDFPPGDTSSINFNSGAAVGMNIFTTEKRSVAFDVRALHISNASIGNHNPGVNASLQFTVGYSWWK